MGPAFWTGERKIYKNPLIGGMASQRESAVAAVCDELGVGAAELAEVRRQIASIHSDGHGHMVHDRPPGDGHDQVRSYVHGQSEST